MPFSKSTRILLLIGIDSLFFLLEIGVGYSVHSLALVADSFHMLNDILSLCVGLWAVKVAQTSQASPMYTYGVRPPLNKPIFPHQEIYINETNKEINEANAA